LWTYGGNRVFSTLATASTFDNNRFTDLSTFAGSCIGTTGNSCKVIDTTYATVNAAGGVTCTKNSPCASSGYDPGFMYEYGQVCPTSGCSTPPPWLDEKTGSGAAILGGCVDWNTFRPLGQGSSSTNPCSLSSANPQSYTYLADAISGVPSVRCGFPTATQMVRAEGRSAIAPPLDPTAMVALSPGGEVRYSLIQMEPGIPPASVSVGTRTEMLQPVYWLEVPRQLHSCRHVDVNQCE
jgi:type IV pilus assembly protein PilY1